MSNYEWLVKNKRLHTFIWDIINSTKEQLKEEYGIIVNWGDVASEKIADWLQAEYQSCQEINVRKVDCSMTEDEYNKGLNDLREGMREAAKSSVEKITCQYCQHCYKQEGVDWDMNPCWKYNCWRTGRAIPTDPHFSCRYAKKRIEE